MLTILTLKACLIKHIHLNNNFPRLMLLMCNFYSLIMVFPGNHLFILIVGKLWPYASFIAYELQTLQ